MLTQRYPVRTVSLKCKLSKSLYTGLFKSAMRLKVFWENEPLISFLHFRISFFNTEIFLTRIDENNFQLFIIVLNFSEKSKFQIWKFQILIYSNVTQYYRITHNFLKTCDTKYNMKKSIISSSDHSRWDEKYCFSKRNRLSHPCLPQRKKLL